MTITTVGIDCLEFHFHGASMHRTHKNMLRRPVIYLFAITFLLYSCMTSGTISVSYFVASSSTSSAFACRSCIALPVLYPFPLPLATPCPDCTRFSCFSMWATWRRSCCHLLVASSSLVLASSTLKMRKDSDFLSLMKLLQKFFITSTNLQSERLRTRILKSMFPFMQTACKRV